MSTSTNYIQRSLHHYNSSPCLSTTRLLSSYSSNSPSGKQIITPKPVKVSPAFSKQRSPLSTNPSPKSNQPFSSPTLDTSPTSPTMDTLEKFSGGNFKSVETVSGTPERLANEELHKILFAKTFASPHLSTATTSNNICEKEDEEEIDIPTSPFSPLSHSPFPSRAFSPPTIELDINESIFMDDCFEDVFDDYDDPMEASKSALPSTFGYDDEDFNSIRNSDQRKRRNFVTQEDISFLIELRTRPNQNSGNLSDDFEYQRSFQSKVEEGFLGAEMGLLSFSPPNSRILNY